MQQKVGCGGLGGSNSFGLLIRIQFETRCAAGALTLSSRLLCKVLMETHLALPVLVSPSQSRSCTRVRRRGGGDDVVPEFPVRLPARYWRGGRTPTQKKRKNQEMHTVQIRSPFG